MKAYIAYLNQLVQHVEDEFVEFQSQINWYHPYKSGELDERRSGLFESIGKLTEWRFANTKPFLNSLSKGCQLCGEGEWSCLFVTGKCNANCFYCPAKQDADETPQTQKLLFEQPSAYVDYINRFGFKGVSFSGGEPLLFFDRTLEFLKQVKQNCPKVEHVWMYTNGILASDDKLKALGEAGLDEIRFDLGAVNYNPKVLKNAAKFIKNVTVEIPAVPHEKEQLLSVLPLLCEYGVSNLNLHQLRLTKYNAPKLLQHEYTMLHGEQPTVAESEITALEIMAFVASEGLPIGVNYCNFQFKNRFQKAGFRHKMAEILKLENEEITQNGFLRTIEADGVAVSIKQLIENKAAYSTVTIKYSGRVIENLTNNQMQRTFDLNGISYCIDEGLAALPIVLHCSEVDEFIDMVNNNGKKIPSMPQLFEAWQHEFIEQGLRAFC
jgi:hypothetical protein